MLPLTSFPFHLLPFTSLRFQTCLQTSLLYLPPFSCYLHFLSLLFPSSSVCIVELLLAQNSIINHLRPTSCASTNHPLQPRCSLLRRTISNHGPTIDSHLPLQIFSSEQFVYVCVCASSCFLSRFAVGDEFFKQAVARRSNASRVSR